MKVKIIKAVYDGLWYADKIGEEFIAGEVYENLPNGSGWADQPNGRLNVPSEKAFIEKGDYEIISQHPEVPIYNQSRSKRWGW
jgi:hypothetical protein